jgi:hypothetical protein
LWSVYDADPDDRGKLEAAAPIWLSPHLLFGGSAMRTYTTRRGRKKAVKRFTNRDGLWMVAIITAALVGMMLLWLLGIVRFDAD